MTSDADATKLRALTAGWQVSRILVQHVNHTPAGRVAVPLRLDHNGDHVADCNLVLSAEQAADLARELIDLLAEDREGHMGDRRLLPDTSRGRTLLSSLFDRPQATALEQREGASEDVNE